MVELVLRVESVASLSVAEQLLLEREWFDEDVDLAVYVIGDEHGRTLRKCVAPLSADVMAGDIIVDFGPWTTAAQAVNISGEKTAELHAAKTIRTKRPGHAR